MKICSFWGVGIYLNRFFLLLIGLFLVAGILGKGLIVFGLVLAHELAHVVVARMLGVEVHEVELLPFGGVARVSSELVFEPWHEFLVAISGPAFNMVLLILAIVGKNFGLWHETFSPFFLQCNLFLALFNLIPALPLDGGRALRAFLARFYGLKKATFAAATVGQLAGSLLIFAGIIGFAVGRTGLDILVVAAFLLYAATKEKSMGPYYFIRHAAQKKSELVTKGIMPVNMFAARRDLRLYDVIKLFVPGKFHFIMLMDEQKGYLGILGENDIVDGILEEGANESIGAVFSKKN